MYGWNIYLDISIIDKIKYWFTKHRIPFKIDKTIIIDKTCDEIINDLEKAYNEVGIFYKIYNQYYKEK